MFIRPFDGCVQLAREQAEKAAGIHKSAAPASSASVKPPVSVTPLSQSGLTAAVATTSMPTLPVAPVSSDNAKLE